MDHISKIIGEDSKSHPSSPNTGVSQSKFLSPCRRVGLKRSAPNKFVVKFKELANLDKTNEISKQIEENRTPVVFGTANKLEKIKTESNSEPKTRSNVLIKGVDINKEMDSVNTDLNGSVAPKKYCDITRVDAKLKNAFINHRSFNTNRSLKNKPPPTKLSESIINNSEGPNNVKGIPEKESKSARSVRNCHSPDLMNIGNICGENAKELSRHNLPSLIIEHASHIKDLNHNKFASTGQPPLSKGVSCTDESVELETSLPEFSDTVDKSSSTTSNRAENTTCSDLTESNSSLCDGLSKTDIKHTEDIVTESSVSVENRVNDLRSKDRNAKRFKTPMKQSFVVKKRKLEANEGVNDIEKRIAEKEKKISEMKVTIANSTKVKKKKYLFFIVSR